MNIEPRKNRYGGSAGGGGYDYQAEAYALIAAKILGQESLPWVETGCDRVPVSVRMETGSGGDDLQIALRQGARIELQAKRGLQKGDDLWNALLALAQAVNDNADTYGVFLTTGDASNTIREQLRIGIERIGKGNTDDQSEILQEFMRLLQENGIHDVSSVCSRLRIIVRDFEPGSSGEEETFAALRRIVAQQELVGAARNTLVSDGLDLIKLRGSRNGSGLVKLFTQNGIRLSPDAGNPLIQHELFMEWSVKVNEVISIPALKVSLPISKAWARLHVMTQHNAIDSKSLAEQIRDYQEWHRLVDSNRESNIFDAEPTLRGTRWAVIVGGPGSGKSTLLRRLTHAWSSNGKLVLRVSLRAVNLRMKHGETFDEALVSVASDGFVSATPERASLLQNATSLLADGLDETDPNRSEIAERIRSWGAAIPERRVVLTTRPIGHNPAWFDGWEHFELLPLDRPDVEQFAATIFALMYEADSQRSKEASTAFLSKLDHSRTASIASRNPQLLGFLIALYINGSDIGGNRFKLFSNIVEQISKQSIPDRRFQYNVAAPIAHRAIDRLGWLMFHDPTISENELIEELGRFLANELSLSSLEGQQRAFNVIGFWEERGLLEKLSDGVSSTYTFIHMTFQEFTATRFLARLSDVNFIEWVRSRRDIPMFRETLLMLGGTERLALAINTLLAEDNPSDPVSTSALLAADILAEAENPPSDLRQQVYDHLLPRLTSQIPMVVYEARTKLRPIAIASPKLVGPMALQLAKHEQQSTREVGCALGLLAGDEYVDAEALLEIFPNAKDTRIKAGARSFGNAIHHEPLIEDLLLKGAAYLLRDNPPPSQIEIVKKKFEGGQISSRANEQLGAILARHLKPQEMASLWARWIDGPSKYFSNEIITIRKFDEAFLESLVVASGTLISEDVQSIESSRIDSIAQLWRILKIGEFSENSVTFALGQESLPDALIEVLRGAILVANLDPKLVKQDAEYALKKINAPKKQLLISLIMESDEFRSKADPIWSFAQGRLRPELLLRALEHPSPSVCWFAALLLLECVERDIVREGMREVLNRRSLWGLAIIAQIASELWQDQADAVILERLEQNLSDDCAPLVKVLGDVCNDSSKRRAEAILRRAIESNNVDMVKAAISSIDKLGLDKLLASTIKSRYYWWFTEGPQDPVEGVIPENAAASLLSHLVAKRQISFGEMREAANAKRSDIQDVAIKALCQHLAEQEELFEPTIEDVNNGKLPSGILNELSKSHPPLCRDRTKTFLKLLASDDLKVQVACLHALGDGWADIGTVEAHIRQLLSAPNPDIRDEATSALRRLTVANSTV